MFGWIKKLMGRYGEWVRTGYTGGPWASRGEPPWPEPAPPPPPPPPPMTQADTHGGRPDTALAAGISPSVPAGLLPPGNEEFRRKRIAEAMGRDAAAKYMREGR